MLRDIVIILLILLSTATAIKKVARINNRKAQEQQVKTVRRPMHREVRL